MGRYHPFMTPARTLAAYVPQAAAICFRPLQGKRAEVLLITSRSGEWAIPKGRIDRGYSPPQAAANEALEEAGVRGLVHEDPLGSFGYLKRGGWAGGAGVRCHVQVFPLLVEDVMEEWLEAQFRKRRWVPASRAGAAVTQPGLAQVLSEFPAWLKRLREPSHAEG